MVVERCISSTSNKAPKRAVHHSHRESPFVDVLIGASALPYLGFIADPLFFLVTLAILHFIQDWLSPVHTPFLPISPLVHMLLRPISKIILRLLRQFYAICFPATVIPSSTFPSIGCSTRLVYKFKKFCHGTHQISFAQWNSGMSFVHDTWWSERWVTRATQLYGCVGIYSEAVHPEDLESTNWMAIDSMFTSHWKYLRVNPVMAKQRKRYITISQRSIQPTREPFLSGTR